MCNKRCLFYIWNLIVCYSLLFSLSDIGVTAAEETDTDHYILDAIVVTGSRIPLQLSEAPKSIDIITRDEIECMPVDSITDVLEYVSGVDVRQRSIHGVQADVGIRGGSYEQTLVLVDGINVNDPQTGHHNFDLPVNLADIERIEILKGPASSIYGPNAFGGVINIITRDIDHDMAGGHVSYGEYDYFDIGAHGNIVFNNFTSRISANRKSSDGHIDDEKADFDIKTINYKGTYKTDTNRFHIGMGYTDKDFGAYQFYSDIFPDQFEKTDSLLLYSSADIATGDIKIKPEIHWRRHNDDFKMNIYDIWYANEHRTDVWGGQVNTQIPSGLGITSLGAGKSQEEINSSNLGDHERKQTSLYAEHKFSPADKLLIGMGGSAVNHSDWGWEYWPGADISVQVTDKLIWFSSAEKSFRVPTFTELYYYTPANQGNPYLTPEESWTYETGMRWMDNNRWNADFSIFMSDAKDVIDWSRYPGETAWVVNNVSEIKTKGFEAGCKFFPDFFSNADFIQSLNISYTYLDSSIDMREMESKYALDHLRHQLCASLAVNWLEHLTHTIAVRYEKRIKGDSHTVADTRLAYTFSRYEAFLEITNLFDTDYVESGFTPMPGRWIICGITCRFDDL